MTNTNEVGGTRRGVRKQSGEGTAESLMRNISVNIHNVNYNTGESRNGYSTLGLPDGSKIVKT